MTQDTTRKRSGYSRYPLSSLLVYNSATVLHYLLGGAGIIVGYNGIAHYTATEDPKYVKAGAGPVCGSIAGSPLDNSPSEE